MKVNVKLENGYLPNRYTKHAQFNQKIDGMPAISFPFELSDVPENTKSIAFMVMDFDSIPVCGYPWIHWVGANLAPQNTKIPANASQSGKLEMIQGNNSTDIPGQKNQSKLSHHYAGPTPPNNTHDYQLTVFALDKKLNLKDGFWLNEMLNQAKGHTLAKASIDLPVKA